MTFCEECGSSNPPDQAGNCRNCGSPVEVPTVAEVESPEPPNEELLAKAHEGIRALIRLLGGDPLSPELAETPERFMSVLFEHAGESEEEPEVPRPQNLATFGAVLLDRVAICPLHLQHYGASVQLSWAPAVPFNAGNVASLAFRGMVQPTAAARRMADRMVELGATGACCSVRVTRSCPGCDSGSPELLMAYAGDEDAVPIRFRQRPV